MRRAIYIFTLIIAAIGCGMMAGTHTPSPAIVPGWFWNLATTFFWAALWLAYMGAATWQIIKAIKKVYV